MSRSAPRDSPELDTRGPRAGMLNSVFVRKHRRVAFGSECSNRLKPPRLPHRHEWFAAVDRLHISIKSLGYSGRVGSRC